MIVLGLDLSLVGTGYVLLEDGKIKEQKLIKSKPSGKEPIKELERLMKIRGQITLPKTDLAVIEGLAFMARNSVSLVQLSALNYMVREYLYINKIPFLIVAPSTLKKFVTGRGNAKKDEMLLETYKRFGESFNNDNLCDAFGLAHCGSAVLGDKQYVTMKQQEEVIKLLKKQLKEKNE
jgi:crossover junction endodeoxyribonuclease RuvC